MVSQGVLRRRAQSEISGCTSYRFESTYWREVAFDGLLHRERQHHHAKMARALQAFGVHESEPRLVAAQLHSAGLFPEASTLYVQAGRDFLRLGQREDLEELLTALNEVLATPAAEHGRRVAHFNDRLWFHALTAHWSQLSGELDAAKERIMSSFQLIEDTPERRNPSVMGNLARVRTEFHLLLGHIHRAQGARVGRKGLSRGKPRRRRPRVSRS